MTEFTEKRFTTEDGLSLYYRDYPAATDAKDPLTLLCMPGLTRSSFDFEPLAAYLAGGRYRILSVDLRGRGKSDYAEDPMTYIPLTYVKDIEQLLRAEKLERVVLIGTSLGGILSMTLAGVSRARLAGVVLNDIGPEIDPAGLDRITRYVGKTSSFETWEEAVEATRAINAGSFPDYGPEDWLAMARRTFREGDDGLIHPNYDLNIAVPFSKGASAPANDLWPFFMALKGLPTLVVRGETSDILSGETVTAMKARYPKLETLTVPGRGHAPYLDEPVVPPRIKSFLDEIPGKRGTARTLWAKVVAAYHLGRIIKIMRKSAA
ncbi:MAG: alpha/beta hydrolase [Pseudomonadota bacterium]